MYLLCHFEEGPHLKFTFKIFESIFHTSLLIIKLIDYQTQEVEGDFTLPESVPRRLCRGARRPKCAPTSLLV